MIFRLPLIAQPQRLFKIYGLHDTAMDQNKGICLVVCTLTDFQHPCTQAKTSCTRLEF